MLSEELHQRSDQELHIGQNPDARVGYRHRREDVRPGMHHYRARHLVVAGESGLVSSKKLGIHLQHQRARVVRQGLQVQNGVSVPDVVRGHLRDADALRRVADELHVVHVGINARCRISQDGGEALGVHARRASGLEKSLSGAF
ncbi:MAG: hypothetical protein IJ904_04685 [Candidatus Methanomethylophilaceae archaeon]|nr:hypothetical protein [Candidatus Methanomethylophilaceae archaeon]